MLERLGRFVVLADEIEDHRKRLERSADKDARLNPSDRQSLGAFFEQWHRTMDSHGLVHAAHLAHTYSQEATQLTYRKAIDRLGELWRDFRWDVGQRWMFVIPADKYPLFEHGLGTETDHAFPLAAAEVREAGACLALGRNTASVFHLMRAAEHGLRALAESVGAVDPAVPLEYQEWGKVLNAVEQKVESGTKGWGKAEWNNFQAFFNPTIRDYWALKDAVRNVCMHARSGGTYNQHEALGIRQRVVECLQRMAVKRVSEGTRTPLLDPARFGS